MWMGLEWMFFSGATGIPTVTSRAVLSKFLTGEIHDFLCRRFLSLETFQLICTQLPHHSCLASSQTAHPPPTVPLTPLSPPLAPTLSTNLPLPPPYANPPATPTCMSTNNKIYKVPQERVVRAEHSRRDRKNVSYAGGGRMK